MKKQPKPEPQAIYKLVRSNGKLSILKVREVEAGSPPHIVSDPSTPEAQTYSSNYWTARNALNHIVGMGNEFISGPHTYDDACEIRYDLREKEGD